MSAHDVRHLTKCDLCLGIADKRHSVRTQRGVYLHGRCYVEQWGLAMLLKLPSDQTSSLTLSDLGPESMRALVDSLSDEERRT